jgi:sulfite oxidase
MMQTRPGAGPFRPPDWTWQKGERKLAVRAWDSPGQTQPALPDDIWNFKGYL